MRDPKRINKILNEIRAVWRRCPEYRLGQLLSNVKSIYHNSELDISYLEDCDLSKALENFKKDLDS